MNGERISLTSHKWQLRYFSCISACAKTVAQAEMLPEINPLFLTRSIISIQFNTIIYGFPSLDMIATDFSSPAWIPLQNTSKTIRCFEPLVEKINNPTICLQSIPILPAVIMWGGISACLLNLPLETLHGKALSIRRALFYKVCDSVAWYTYQLVSWWIY